MIGSLARCSWQATACHESCSHRPLATGHARAHSRTHALAHACTRTQRATHRHGCTDARSRQVADRLDVHRHGLGIDDATPTYQQAIAMLERIR